MEIDKSKYLNRFQTKKNPWFEEVKRIADRMNEPIGKWLKTFAGWDYKDIYNVYHSANALSIDKGLPFSKSLNWHINEILEKK